jgi:hypothetical protein
MFVCLCYIVLNIAFNMSLDDDLGQWKSAHTFKSYIREIHFNITLYFRLDLPKLQECCCIQIVLVSCVCYVAG